MSIYWFNGGRPKTAFGTLANTNATAILTANNLANRHCVIVGLHLTNHSGGALTPNVDIYNGSTAYLIWDAKSMSDGADSEVDLPGGFYELISGNSLRLTANANLTWHVSYIEPDPYGGNI